MNSIYTAQGVEVLVDIRDFGKHIGGTYVQTDKGIVTVNVFQYDGGIYSVSQLGEKVIFCNRLA